MPDADVANSVAQTWPLVEVVLATGAVGVAAAGIVDGLKWTPLGLAGFGRIGRSLGSELMGAVARSYGEKTRQVLHGYYRKERVGGALGKALRQGVRVGATSEEAGGLARAVGAVIDPQALESALSKLERGTDVSDSERSVIGRFELAVDARIDAALAVANATYVGSMRMWASAVALLLALVGTHYATSGGLGAGGNLAIGFVIGIAAVPLAPIAKDVASGLRAARRATTAAQSARTT